jgi:thioredoxin 1
MRARSVHALSKVPFGRATAIHLNGSRFMTMNTTYAATEPSRAEVDALQGPALLEFGAPWCPHCQAAQPLIAAALANAPEVQHLKVEDGKGRRLGRSFQVKLWPSLIFLRDGKEVTRLVRPPTSQDISAALAQIANGGSRKE